ncbi:MAG: hypothetical protein A2Z28_04480 [Chloroflexi bacterium RBG_16_51_9]|nr:MAG: hypothetical protein A2Z28_04480 [Chloroflexi bacterium RBG_16_51_9]
MCSVGNEQGIEHMRIVQYFKDLLSSTPAKETGEEAEMMTVRVSGVYKLHSMASAIIPDDSQAG